MRESDEVFAVTSTGVVIRVPVEGLRLLSRATGGVKLISVEAGATVVSVARNGESEAQVEQALEAGAEAVPTEVVVAEEGAALLDRDPAAGLPPGGSAGVPGADDETTADPADAVDDEAGDDEDSAGATGDAAPQDDEESRDDEDGEGA